MNELDITVAEQEDDQASKLVCNTTEEYFNEFASILSDVGELFDDMNL